MEPELAKPASKSGSAGLGILAGLAIGFGVAVACVFIFFLLLGIPQNAWYSKIVAVIPFLLPPAVVLFVGLNARRERKNKFAAGLFIAAAVVTLFEATCATGMFWR